MQEEVARIAANIAAKQVALLSLRVLVYFEQESSTSDEEVVREFWDTVKDYRTKREAYEALKVEILYD